MTLIKDLGFRIYRLRMAADSSEFLLYDSHTEKYYQYSYTRGKSMLQIHIEKLLGQDLPSYMYRQGIVDPKEGINKVNSIFIQWINEDIELIDNINYKPIEDRIFQEEGYIYYNIYRKSELLKSDFEKFPLHNDFPHIKRIIENLTGYDPRGYNYFLKWLAWQVQHPLERLATSIILKGEQGSGKTLLCDFVLKPIFATNFVEISQNDLVSEFDEYIMGKQFIVANEVVYNEKNKNYSQSLKKKVTDNYINVKRKFRDSLYLPNYSHWLFTSNSQVPIHIERGDRRFTVFKSKTLQDGVAFFQEFLKVQESELISFVKHLYNLEVKLAEVNYPYINNERKDVIEASLNSVELFFEALEDNTAPGECLSQGIMNLNSEYSDPGDWFNNIIFLPSAENKKYISLESLYNLYKKFSAHAGVKYVYGRNGFTSILRHLNFHVTVVKDDSGKSYRVMRLTNERDN